MAVIAPMRAGAETLGAVIIAPRSESGIEAGVVEGLAGLARVLGLADRGRLDTGLRADLVVMEREARRIVAVFAGGDLAWMSGPVAARFMS